jgi:hypothetical protein
VFALNAAEHLPIKPARLAAPEPVPSNPERPLCRPRLRPCRSKSPRCCGRRGSAPRAGVMTLTTALLILIAIGFSVLVLDVTTVPD